MGLINLILMALALFVANQALKLIAWSHRKKAMRVAIASLSEFTCSRSHIGDGAHDGIAIDEKQGIVYFLSRSRTQVNAYRVGADDIVTVDVIEEHGTRTTQSGSSVIVMFGRIGVPVGGPRYKTRHYVSYIELRTAVTDPLSPSHSVTFLAAACKRGGIAHLFYAEQAEQWQSRIQSLAATAQSRSPAASTSSPCFSVADELRKLAALKDDGFLSNQEFENQRAKLLAS